MISSRPWIAMMVAGCCSVPIAAAQTGTSPASASSAETFSPSEGAGTGGAPSGGTGSGASSSFGSTPASGSGAASSFTPTPPPTAPATDPYAGATGGGTPTTGSQSSSQGTGFGTAKVPAAAASSFTLPGFYGGASTVFTAGEGRLARPRFRYTVFLSSGYDDNPLQASTNAVDTPAIFQDVLVDPGTPPTLREVPVFATIPAQFTQGGLIIPARQVQVGNRLEIVPGTAPKIKRVQVVAAQPAQKRVGSAVTRGNASVDIQIFSKRSLFTFDLSAGADHFWSRPGPKQTDYNGSLVFSFLYRLTPRLQFTAQVNSAYLTQPDLSRINTPQQQQNGGAYLNTNAKLDFSYRWSPRFTTVVSFSDNSLFYQEKAQEAGDYNDTVFGTEFRYLWSPRLTLLAEVRYSAITYDLDPGRDATTAFLLIGAEAQFSRRLGGSLRIGESLRSFDESGKSSSTPYLEGTVAYRVGPTSVVNLTTRFGFEEPTSAGSQRLVYRGGLSFNQAFSPRLSGSASINYLHDTSTSENSTSVATNTYDTNLRLDYLVTRKFSLNASYSFTSITSEERLRDYYRNRIFFGGEYTF